MAIVSQQASAFDDRKAIADLHRTFEAQKKAFLKNPYPSLEERLEHLGALAATVMEYRERIQDAMRSDFASHPDVFTDLVEVLGVAGRAQFAMENLEKWMAPEEREVNKDMFGTGRAEMRHEPKGVIGNLVPWNFPYDLSVGPLVDMLAAGNRAIIKPSEYTPACGEVMDEMLGKVFDRDHVAVVQGGVDLSVEFTSMRWDHLLYTGGTEVGRKVATAAAQNLVPTTLELGGKCPAVIAPDSVKPDTVANIVGTKLMKSGQVCISVDYALVPRDQMDEFVRLSREFMRDNGLSDFSRTGDCAGIITDRHLDRLLELLKEAEDRGVELIQLDEDGALDRENRRMPTYLAIDPPQDIGIMKDEIFGPIMPVVPYDSLDEALAWVNSRERPLALYAHSPDRDTAEKILRQTTSGGACINACATHGAHPSLGFGGIGASGTGRHHGWEGFREFSNPRGTFIRGENDLMDAFLPPYGPEAQGIVDAAFQGGEE